MTRSPFQPGLDAAERKVGLRCLRQAVRELAGHQGADAAHALLLAVIDPSPDTLAEASAAFDALPLADRSRCWRALQDHPPALHSPCIVGRDVVSWHLVERRAIGSG